LGFEEGFRKQRKGMEMVNCMLVVAVILTVMSNFKSGNFAKPLITLGLAYFLFKVGSRPFEVILGFGEEGGMRFRFFLLLLCTYAVLFLAYVY
jgi:hypothetical protein